MGNGLITSRGADWKWQRQTTAPVFRQAEVLQYLPAMVTSAEETIARWRAAKPGSVHAVDKDVSDATYQVIAETMLRTARSGVQTRGTRQGTRRLAEAYGSSGYRVASLSRARGEGAAERDIRASVALMVEARRTNKSERNDLVSRLTASPRPRERAADVGPADRRQPSDLFVAGHSTSAKALTWILYLVARSAEWERRMLGEIASRRQRSACRGAHRQAHCRRDGLKEAMRLYPPSRVPARAERGCRSQWHADQGRQHRLYADHRHPSTRSPVGRPGRFDPARFAPEHDVKRCAISSCRSVLARGFALAPRSRWSRRR